jgi:hypothetical protein
MLMVAFFQRVIAFPFMKHHIVSMATAARFILSRFDDFYFAHGFTAHSNFSHSAFILSSDWPSVIPHRKHGAVI